MKTPGRRVDVLAMTLDEFMATAQPGDYYGPIRGYSGEHPAVFFLLPIARDRDVPAHARCLHHVCSPPHVFTEGPNGLTIRESIGAGHPRPYYWHGYLTDGVWEDV